MVEFLPKNLTLVCLKLDQKRLRNALCNVYVTSIIKSITSNQGLGILYPYIIQGATQAGAVHTQRFGSQVRLIYILGLYLLIYDGLRAIQRPCKCQFFQEVQYQGWVVFPRKQQGVFGVKRGFFAYPSWILRISF